VPAGGVRTQQRGERPPGEIVMGNQMLQQQQGRDRVVKGIMPASSGVMGLKGWAKSAAFTEGGQRVIRQFRPSGTAKQQGIDPRAEAVSRKSPQEALLSALPMGDDDRPGEVFFHLGPQGKQGRGTVEILVADPVDLARGPGDRGVAGQIGHEALAMAVGGGPGGKSHLHRDIGPAAGSPGGLEVDGSKTAVPNRHGQKGSMAGRGLAMGNAPDGGLPRGARWRKFRRS
jgi:hypothetical protein